MLYVVAREGPARGVSVTVSDLGRAEGGSLGDGLVEVAPLAYVKRSGAGSSDPSLAGETAARRRSGAAFEPRILRRDIRRFDVPGADPGPVPLPYVGELEIVVETSGS